MTDTPLQPGPEGDALVAKAMGRTVIRADDWDVSDHEGLHAAMDAAGYPCLVLWSNQLSEYVSHIGISREDIAYTTSGDGMLEMLEWMWAKPREWEVTLSGLRYDSEGMRIVTVFAPDRSQLAHIEAERLELAVAAALLAACEVKT